MSTSKDSQPDEFQMGFRDKQKAIDTLKALEGRDPKYQFQAILNYVSRAKKTLRITRVKKKLANIEEALQVFEEWLTHYKANKRSKDNLNYLTLETIRPFRALAKEYNVLDDSFYIAYKQAKGYHRTLRAVKITDGTTTWDIHRNKQLKSIIDKIKSDDGQWYETAVGKYHGFPTIDHVRCIQLGYSPDPRKLWEMVAQLEENFERVSEPEEPNVKDDGEGLEKRKRDDRSDDEELIDEPEKKSAKKDLTKS